MMIFITAFNIVTSQSRTRYSNCI